MSGSAKYAPVTRVGQHLRLPRAPGLDANSQAINAALDLLERADAGNVKTGQRATLAQLVLISPGGEGFLVTVDDNGQLRTEQMPGDRFPRVQAQQQDRL